MVRDNGKRKKGGKSGGVILDGVSRKMSQRRGKLDKDLKEVRETAPQKFKGKVPDAPPLPSPVPPQAGSYLLSSRNSQEASVVRAVTEGERSGSSESSTARSHRALGQCTAWHEL